MSAAKPFWVLLSAIALVPALAVTAGTAQAASGSANDVRQMPGIAYAPDDRVVALTFDDGPSPYTDAVLDVLARKQAKATFFMAGGLAAAYPDRVRRVVADGHAVAGHTWSHTDLTKLSASGYGGQVDRTTALLESFTGYPVGCTRPPYGAVNSSVVTQLRSRGQTPALWTTDPQDWRRPGTDAIVSRSLSGLTNGSVILMHDGGGERSQTVAALPRIIDGIRARGFRLVTICAPPVPVDTAVRAYGSVAGNVTEMPTRSAARIVGGAVAPSDTGYVLAAADGGVFRFGAAGFFGSAGGRKLNAPMTGIADTPTGQGYWLVASDGGIFTFGDAPFLGSTGGTILNQPVVGMAPTLSGKGYWLVAADGGIFAYGDARFLGSTGGTTLNRPVVGMAPTPSGNGYWLVAADGGIFAYGDARFLGSTGGTTLNRPVVGMAPTPSGNGYWLVAADGGIFAYGNAPFLGSPAADPKPMRGAAIVPSRDGRGYWVMGDR